MNQSAIAEPSSFGPLAALRVTRFFVSVRLSACADYDVPPRTLHIWASAGGSLGALASGQKNAVLRRGPSLLHPLLLGLSHATKELRLVYHLDPQLLRLLQFAPGILSRDQRSGLLADAAGHPAAGLLDE